MSVTIIEFWGRKIMKLRDEDIFLTTAFYTESGVTFGVIIAKHLPTDTSITIDSGSLAEIKEMLARRGS